MDETLFSEGKIGSLTIKNRFVMAPMGNHFGNADTAVSPRQMDYYEARAAGGVGLLITESCPVSPQGAHGHGRMRIYHGDAERKLKELAARVHTHGAKIALQLTHGGGRCSPDVIGEYPLSPSAKSVGTWFSRQASEEELREIVASFRSSALLAERCGMDAVQILAASGHLPHQFLSPRANRRTDAYGGSLENRYRLLGEVVRAIRAAVSLPILIKLYGPDSADRDGTWVDLDEYPAIAGLLAADGADSIHLTSNYTPDAAHELDVILRMAERVKKSCGLPISVACGIFDKGIAERVLSHPQVEFAEIGRGLIADPDFVLKLRRDEPPRPCLGCNYCRSTAARQEALCCAVNPHLGAPALPAASGEGAAARRIAIIGGGPAGMEAATILSKLGHTGVVFEARPSLGGLLAAAAVPPGKSRLDLFARYQHDRFAESGFAVRLGTRVDVDALPKEVLEAEYVLVAVGGEPIWPGDLSRQAPNVYEAVDLLANERRPQGEVVVLGGGETGCEAADYLSEDSGCRVTLLVTSPRVLRNCTRFERERLLRRLGDKGVLIRTGARMTGYDGKRLLYARNGKEHSIPCAAVVLAKGSGDNKAFAAAMERKLGGGRVFTIGDARFPNDLITALSDARKVALHIHTGKTLEEWGKDDT